MALAQAGKEARGADVYVTLEPCFLPGRGAPCTQSLIDAGVAKVFIAIRDPNPRVNGQGIDALRAAGIVVVEGLCADEAATLNKGFLLLQTQQRPMITLKLAVSADWKMSTGDKNNPWITGEVARMHAHLLRANHDAILVGIGTVLADNPMLDCRIPGLEEFSPVRVVLDSNLKIPLDSKLVQSANIIPLWILHINGSEKKIEELNSAGVILVRHPGEGRDPESNLDWTPAFARVTLKLLAGRGMSRVLIEGGARVAQNFLNAELIDEVMIYQSSKIVGDSGLPAPELPKEFMLKEEKHLGDDHYRYYVKA
jgi:diaminohydroxyphosphoribosylaminopyrimidine deaminase/5-amino-6-(5-phosphoribosylamino)uracil reductase